MERTSGNSASRLMRSRGGSDSGKVSFIELFFDLVFVFAVTQLSHTLLEHFSLEGAIHLALLTMAVWWAWIFTSWAINWLNPDTKPVRIMLIALMLTGLVVSSSIPEAFGHGGLYFGVAYTAFQVGRTAFTVWALRDGPAELRINFVRILAWLSLSGVFWISGGLAHDSWRLALWAAALIIEYISPSLGFWLPRVGRTPTRVWDVEGSHMSERCGLFVIIALGESILVTGATFAKLEWSLGVLAGFAVSFAGTVAMWRIYFGITSKVGHHYIANSSDPGRIARSAYTYTHLLLVAGIILSAVADEWLLAHPTGDLDAKMAAVILGGPALYLLGNLLFMRIVAQVFPKPYLFGLLALAALAPFAAMMPIVALSAATAAVLAIVSVWGGVFSERLCRHVPSGAPHGQA